MTNRMDYIHRKSRGRELNESMLNEAVYNMKDVREMWYKKIKLLSDPRKQINLHAKLSKIEPGLRDAELAKILLHNFPGTSPGFINSIISSTFGDPDWLEILNTRFGTDIDMDYLKSCFARMRGPELDQKTLQAIGKKEDAFIKQIESGRGNTKSEEVMKVAASTKRTYIAGSFEEVYELVTTRNDFEGRYEKNPDGTISINMADIPLTMVRAMYGLRVIDDAQPLVYIVFGPNGGNDKVIKDHAKQELDLFLRNSHEEKELQEMHIGYYDLRPCGLEYWWTNVSKRFVSKKDNEAVDKVRNSNATLVLSRDGECVLMTEGFESEPEIDPAVNPGNAPVTAPIEDEYGFDTVKESKNNDIRMNRYNRNWARPESARLRRYADMLESMDDSRNSKGRNTLFEAKALTPEEKMDRWHNGTRKENIKACNIDKLKEYRKICRAKGYTEQVKIINAELKRRKDEGINESQLPSRGINLQPGGEFYNMDKDTFMSIYDMLVKKYGEDRIIYNKLGYGIVTLWLDEIGPNGYEIIFWSELGTLIDVDLLRHLLPGSIFV